jgi:hypothetical protein
MVRADYYVLKNGNYWNVQFGDKVFACNKQTVAFKAAVNAAQVAGARGYPSQVLVEGPDGQWQTQWVYGIDRYPLSA